MYLVSLEFKALDVRVKFLSSIEIDFEVCWSHIQDRIVLFSSMGEFLHAITYEDKAYIN